MASSHFNNYNNPWEGKNMPTGKRLTRVQRAEIMRLHADDFTGIDIAELMSLGSSTISRVIAQEIGKLKKPKYILNSKTHLVKRNISISATAEDHELVTKYADEHGIPKHIALHELLNPEQDTTINIINDKVDAVIQQVEDLVAKANKKSWKFWR